MEQIIDYRYPLANTYWGHADLCEYEVTIPTTIFDAALTQAMINSFQAKVREQAAEMLTLKVWRDYQMIESEPGVFFTLTILKGKAVATHPLPLAAWVGIVEGALSLAGLVVILLVTIKVTDFIYTAGGTLPGGAGSLVVLIIVAVVLLTWQPWKHRT